MAVHFCPAFAVISRTTSLTNRSNSGVPGVASGPSTAAFSESRSATKRTALREIAGWLRSFSEVSIEPVKATRSWPVRWSSRSPVPPATNCRAPAGRMPDFGDQLDQRLGDIGGGRGRLGDHRHPGQERRRQLLQQAPAREVEGVDVDGDAGQRRQHMHADEAAALGQPLDPVLQQEALARQLAAPARGIGEDRAQAAIDVDQVVAPGRPGVGGQRIERLLALGQVQRQRLQQVGALVEGQPAQRRAADLAGMADHRREVQAAARQPGHHPPVDGAGDVGQPLGRGDPAVLGVALQDGGHGVLPIPARSVGD